MVGPMWRSTVLALMLAPACQRAREEVRIDFEDGTPHYRFTLVDGRFEGPYVRTFPDGKPALQGVYHGGP
jgi:hypothetical protein